MMKHVEIWTDGCALGNPGIGGAGAVFRYEPPQGAVVQRTRRWALLETTNNRAELEAIIRALKALTLPCTVDIYSDSQITVRCANGEYNRNSNLDLWEQFETASWGHVVRLHWIRKDTHRLNRVAHELANEAARQRT